jgi:hypothetical protein
MYAKLNNNYSCASAHFSLTASKTVRHTAKKIVLDIKCMLHVSLQLPFHTGFGPVTLEMPAETQADHHANWNILGDINKTSNIKFHDNL